ncbi:MAG: hypothetical protein ACSHYB_15570 [Roseibacillus sp.]
MTIEWLQNWLVPISWIIIDVTWLAVSILLYRTIAGKTCIAAGYSLLISCLSTVGSFIERSSGKRPFLDYDDPLYFILFDISWPFSLFSFAIFMGIATIRIHAIVRRNKELESFLTSNLPTDPTNQGQST